MAKISVIVPIYEVEKYLRECLNSIINQTFKDLEIILIDDGSKDLCPQIVDEYASKDNRIIAVHKTNNGYGHSCNLGLDKASGEYVAIVEPDDYIDLEMFEDLYEIAKKHDSDIVKSCYFDNLQSKNEIRIWKTKWKDFIPENISFTIEEYPHFLHYHPSIWSCIYKKKFLDDAQIRFVEAPNAGWVDNPFQVQTLCLAKKINYTSNAYYYYRRLCKNPADSLKDWTLPFKRSDEIHKWLEINMITSPAVLQSLYCRELRYINTVLNKKNIPNIKNCFTEIQKMLNRIDKKLVLNYNGITKQDKNLYSKIFENPIKARRAALFNRMRQSIIRIRLSKREKQLILFGKPVFKLISENNRHKSLNRKYILKKKRKSLTE